MKLSFCTISNLKYISASTALLVLLGGMIGVLGSLVLPATASAQGTTVTLYASPGSTVTSGCNTSSSPCSLTGAIGVAGSEPSGDSVTIYLEHSNGASCSTGSACEFIGDQNISSSAAASSITIEPSVHGLPVSAVILNGNNSTSGSGSTFVNNAPTTTTVVLQGVTVKGGDSGGSGGGGIDNSGTMTVTGSTISGNVVNVSGGGIDNSGTMTVTGSTISGNSTGYEGGGIYNSGTMTVTGSTVSDNSSSGGGGAGIFNVNSGTMTVTGSTISGNKSSSASGGGAGGGGIFNFFGTMTVIGSTISGNSSSSSSSTGSGGGGIKNSGTTAVVDSTISGNNADFEDGGGIYNNGSGAVIAIDSTISGNSASNGGGIYNSNNAYIAGSVVANQATGNDNCGGSGSSSNSSSAPVTDEGYNFSNGTSCVFSASTSRDSATNLDIGSLANNGGPTETMAIPGSSAAAGFIASPATVNLGGKIMDICGGSSTAAYNSYGGANLGVDQRGIARPSTGCSVGAYQAPPAVTAINPNFGPTIGGSSVAITGTGFVSGATVMFGTVTATAVTVNSSASITAISPPGSSGMVNITVTTPSGTSVASPAAQFSYVAPDAYTSVNPERLADTRCSATPQPSYCSGENLPAANASLGTLSGGKSENVTVTGVDGIPNSATAVVINVTAVDMTSSGYFTIYPEGSAPAVVSSLNWTAKSDVVTNLVTAPVNTSNGEITITNGSSGNVDFVVDVEGYYAAPGSTQAGLYNSVTPARLVDSRCSESPLPADITSSYCSALPSANSKVAALGAKQTENVTVTGTGNVPSTGVSAVVLNLTAIGPSVGGYLTAYPAGTTKALVSTANFVVDQTVPNRVIVKVGTGGQISIYNNSGNTNFAVDVSGYYTDGSSSTQTGSLFTPAPPARILDTRCSQSPQPGYCPGENLPAVNALFPDIAAGRSIAVQVAGKANIPSTATAVVGNLTATGGTGGGYLTVYSGSTAPKTSDVNFAAGTTNANMVISGLNPSGQVNIANGGGQNINAVLDVSGWFGPATS